jgi:hypothetical protein
VLCGPEALTPISTFKPHYGKMGIAVSPSNFDIRVGGGSRSRGIHIPYLSHAEVGERDSTKTRGGHILIGAFDGEVVAGLRASTVAGLRYSALIRYYNSGAIQHLWAIWVVIDNKDTMFPLP